MADQFESLLLLSGSDLTVRWLITLLHFLWQGAIVFAVVAITETLLRRASAQIRYVLYSGAMLSLPVCVAVTFCVVELPTDLQLASNLENSVDIPINLSDIPSKTTETNGTVHIETAEVTDSSLHIDQNDVDATAMKTVADENPESFSISSLAMLSRAAPWITVAYIAGVLFFLFRLLTALWGGHHLRIQTTPVTDTKLLKLISDQAIRMKLKSIPLVALCEQVAVPTVLGVLRPMVLLPVPLMTGLSSDDFTAIIRHEFAHIRRYDLWMNLLQRIVESLLFFHPVVWFISRRLTAEREVCCDDLVVSSGYEPMLYAGALLRMAELCASSRKPNSLALAASGEKKSLLENRIERLMNWGSTPQLQLTRAGMAGLLMTLVFLIAVPGIAHNWTQSEDVVQQENAQPENAEEETLPTPKEILSAYHANFKNMMPFGMNYRVKTLESIACIDRDKRSLRAAKIISKVKRTDLKHEGKVLYDEKTFRMFITQNMHTIQRLKGELTPEIIKYRLAERLSARSYFWTDGKSFHRRWPLDGKDKNTILNSGSVTPPENLNTKYNLINIASWSMDHHPPLRGWYGGGKNKGQGWISNDPDGNQYLCTYAPIGSVITDKPLPLEWHNWDRYNLDLFMSGDPSQYRVIRKEILNGRSTILVDGLLTPAGKTGSRERIRAWIDPEQGYLPLRLEWTQINLAGKAPNGIRRHIEITEVKKVESGYYPVRIKHQEYIYDSIVAEKQTQEQYQDIKAGLPPRKHSPTPLVPGRTRIWEVTEFTPNKAIEPAALALEFPKGTRYRNDVNGRKYIAGDPSPLPLPPKQIPQIQVGKVAPPLQVASWIDGKSRKLSDFRGKVVFLILWNSPELFDVLNAPDDMKIYIASMKKWMKKFHAKYTDKGVVFLDVYSPGSDIKKIREFQKFRGFETLSAIDKGKKSDRGKTELKYNGSYNSLGVFIIGRNGHIALNNDAMEGDSAEEMYYYAASELSIPLPIDETVSEEKAMNQSLKIMEFIISDQVEKALAQP